MGSPHGYDAGLEFDELLGLSIDRGSGAVVPGVRLTNAATNLGQQSLYASANVALSNSSVAAQNVFGGSKQVTLQANTIYVFEGQIFVQSGATSHTNSLGFSASTALAAIDYTVNGQAATASGGLIAAFGTIIDIHAVTATVVSPALTTNVFQYYEMYGALKTGNAVTTLQFQITFSAGPTGTCQINSGSFLTFYPAVSQ